MKKHRIPILEPEKIIETLADLPEPLKHEALTQFTRAVPPRHGSTAFARKMKKAGTPELAISDEDRRNMALMVAHNKSYRVIERVYHLAGVEGNDVYRCVQGILKKDRVFAKTLRPIARAHGVKLPRTTSRIKKAQFVAAMAVPQKSKLG